MPWMPLPDDSLPLPVSPDRTTCWLDCAANASCSFSSCATSPSPTAPNALGSPNGPQNFVLKCRGDGMGRSACWHRGCLEGCPRGNGAALPPRESPMTATAIHRILAALNLPTHVADELKYGES